MGYLVHHKIVYNFKWSEFSMKFFELLKMPSKNKSKGKANQEVESKASSAEAVALAEPVEATEAIEATTEATIEATTEVDPEVEATIEATTINDSNEEKPKESTSKAEPNESPEDIVKNILEKLGLASSDSKPDDKIDTLCVIFKQTLTENVQLKETLVNMNGPKWHYKNFVMLSKLKLA